MDEANLDTQNQNEKGKVKGRGKGKEKQTDAPIESKFKWTDSYTMNFFESLKYYKMKNGYNTGYVWADIVAEFLKRTKVKILPKTAQNKYNSQKQIWLSWGKIRHIETGIGWDEKTGRIIADDEWWEKKKRELGTEYSLFRKKGVDPDLCDLWDDVFSEHVASGKHAVSATMNADSVPLLMGNEEVDISEKSASLDEQLEKDLDDDSVDFITSLGSPPQASGSQATSSQSGKGNGKEGSQNKVKERKRRRRPLSTATVMQEKISSLADSGKEMVSLMKKDLEGSNDVAYDEGIQVLERLVDTELVIGGSKVWCFAMTELLKPDKLRCFMKIKTDEYRAKWIANECEREMGSEK